ncbi:MAG: ATP-binding protein [Patescibacteria group bacterium]|jgi:PAS domain S-box-containing protein|nr:ATP-binding protein [Patescibacteria group bacterium]
MSLYFVVGTVLVSVSIILILFLKSRKERVELKSLRDLKSSLAANESKESALLLSIADGVYMVDTERNLTMFNPAAEEMTGWTKEEAVGLKCWTVLNLKNEQDDSICQNDCPAKKVWTSGENIVRDDTCFIRHRGAKSVQVSSSYAPIRNSNGDYSGAICVFRDITEKKEVERQRNEFVSTASHELRTPITALEGYISLAENGKICQIDEKAHEYLDKAHQTALGMSDLVKNLLTITKIEDAKIQISVGDFSIHDLAGETVEVLQPFAKEKNLYLKLNEVENQEIKGEKAIGRSLNVRADREKIREVLYNLIENGLKFTTTGGVSISINYDKDFSTVTVSDTGMGISSDGQQHIFEKFYRVDNTATREAGGTGLGLFITRSLVEMSGGRIWLESQVGKGTKFYFTLPRSID